MIAQWTGRVVGEMHIHRISNKDLAEELNVTPRYVGMVLLCQKTPKNAEERFTEAVRRLIEKKGET